MEQDTTTLHLGETTDTMKAEQIVPLDQTSIDPELVPEPTTMELDHLLILETLQEKILQEHPETTIILLLEAIIIVPHQEATITQPLEVHQAVALEEVVPAAAAVLEVVAEEVEEVNLLKINWLF